MQICHIDLQKTSIHFTFYANYYLTVNNTLVFLIIEKKIVQPKSLKIKKKVLKAKKYIRKLSAFTWYASYHLTINNGGISRNRYFGKIELKFSK